MSSETMNISEDYSLLSACTLSYIPYALVTLRTAKAVSPRLRLYLFVADGTSETVAYLKKIPEFLSLSVDIFGPSDLSPQLRDPYLACFNYYNTFEVSNVAKYVGLKHVLASNRDGAIYIYADSDISFFGDVVAALSREESAPVLLTSHQFRPSSDDVESEYLLHGWLNSGFSVFDGSDARVLGVLDWMIHRISRRGYLAPQFGLSGDQPWLSGLPFLFPEIVSTCSAPGLNVAYWNLSERALTEADGRIECNGEPLIFFHFSGFIGAKPGILSKHAETKVAPGSILDKLCQRYSSELEVSEILRAELSGLPIIPSSRLPLPQRIYKGSLLNKISIDSPTVKRGVFSRVGMRLDALLSCLLH